MALERLGPYRIDNLLGRGGMGAVYVGVEESTGQRVAVKVLSSGMSGDSNFRDRFQTEIETLKKLQHPNIVEMIGYGEQEGHLFYSMELVEGRSLQEELNQGRRFPWREVVGLTVQICAALKHAHDRGVIHRDLKPANLLLTSDDRIKLLDFGIAKLFGGTQLTSAGGVIGTVDFMAPEQAGGRPVNTRTDLYSLGAVMYCLLAGRPPFHAKTLPEVIHSLRYEDPRPIRHLVPDVPFEMEQVITQLLAKEPEERIATAQSVAKRLRAMERGLSVETRTDLATPPDSPPRSRSSLPPADKLSAAETGLAEQPSLAEQGEITRMATSARPTVDVTDLEGDDEYRLADMPQETLASRAEVARSSSATAERSRTHFTTVAEDKERRRGQRSDYDQEGPVWLKPVVTAAMLAIIVALVAGAWYATRPSSADQMYQQIAVVAEEGEPQQLVELDGEMRQFLELYGKDERSGAVRLWQRDLQSYRLQRRLEREARAVGGAGYLEPLEQAFLRAARTRRSDPDAARRQFDYLLVVFGQGGDLTERQRQCLEMARHELQRLESPREVPDVDLAGQLDQRLEWAEQHLDEQQLREFQQGVVGLFGDEPWASETVDRCRQALRSAGP